MNPTNATVPSPSTTSTSIFQPVLHWVESISKFWLVVLTLISLLIAVIAIDVAASAPKPETYTRPLQAQQAAMQKQQLSLQEQARYGRVMSLNYTLLVVHYNLVVADANAGNVSATEEDAVKLSTSTLTYISDLKKLTVPACLQQTNTTLLAGLTDIQQGAAALDKALIANDTGQGAADAQRMSQGMAQETTAEGEYAAAVC